MPRPSRFIAGVIGMLICTSAVVIAACGVMAIVRWMVFG